MLTKVFQMYIRVIHIFKIIYQRKKKQLKKNIKHISN